MVHWCERKNRSLPARSERAKLASHVRVRLRISDPGLRDIRMRIIDRRFETVFVRGRTGAPLVRARRTFDAEGGFRVSYAFLRGRWLVAPDVDLVSPLALLMGVVPRLHPQQRVHAHAEGLLDPQRHLRR